MTFRTTMDLRFRDIDPMGHVNNAVYATFLEQARARYYDAVLGEDLVGVDTVLARQCIDYERPIALDQGPVEVTVDVRELGRSSLDLASDIVRGDGELAATAEVVQVAFDRETGRSRPIPDAWREAIEDYHDL